MRITSIDIKSGEVYRKVCYKGIIYIDRIIATPDSIPFPSVEVQHIEYMKLRSLRLFNTPQGGGQIL